MINIVLYSPHSVGLPTHLTFLLPFMSSYISMIPFFSYLKNAL